MKLSEEMACVELITLVTDYLDGALTPNDRERFEEHMAVCTDCANHLDQIRATIAVAGRLRPEDLAPETAAELLEAFRDWKRA